MEHYRSTLATTAVAVLGLVVAAHILHPGNYEEPFRPARAAASAPNAAATGASAWTDPPVRQRVEPASPLLDAVVDQPAPAAPAWVSETVPAPQRTVVRAERSHRAGPAERRRLALRAARARQASLVTQTATGLGTTSGTQARETRTPDRIDPIGDLMRGLGLGRDG